MCSSFWPGLGPKRIGVVNESEELQLPHSETLLDIDDGSVTLKQSLTLDLLALIVAAIQSEAKSHPVTNTISCGFRLGEDFSRTKLYQFLWFSFRTLPSISW